MDIILQLSGIFKMNIFEGGNLKGERPFLPLAASSPSATGLSNKLETVFC